MLEVSRQLGADGVLVLGLLHGQALFDGAFEVLGWITALPLPGDPLAVLLALAPGDAALAVARLRAVATALELDNLNGEWPAAARSPAGV
eukprot:3451414-Alexandrium_andersonii.AAC.1